MNVQEGGVFQFFGGRMTSRGQCPRRGACECPRVGAFFKLMTSRGQCPRGGGAAGVPPIQVQTPPPTWLAGYGPGMYVCMYVYPPPSRAVSSFFHSNSICSHMVVFVTLNVCGRGGTGSMHVFHGDILLK